MSGPDCIPVLVPKLCETELSYILFEVFNISEGFVFSRLFKCFISGPKNVGEGPQLKTTALLVFFLWLVVVSKVFEKLVNKRTVDHIEKFGLIFISSVSLGLYDQLQIF